MHRTHQYLHHKHYLLCIYVRIFPTVFMYLGLHGNKAPVFFYIIIIACKTSPIVRGIANGKMSKQWIKIFVSHQHSLRL